MSASVLNAEEKLDSVYRLAALVLLIVGIAMATEAIELLVSKGSLVDTVNSAVGKVCMVITLLLSTLCMWKCVRFKMTYGRNPLQVRDGYVMHSIRNAAITAGITTYVAVNVLNIVVDEPSALPASFYLRIVIALMNFVFGVVYLQMSWVTARADDEDALA